MQTNRKSFGTLKSDRYGRVAAMAGFTVTACTFLSCCDKYYYYYYSNTTHFLFMIPNHH